MNIALILASGTGSRMGQNKCPKQFIDVNGLPLFLYSVKTFEQNNLIDQIVVVTNKEQIEKVKNICQEHHINKLASIVSGGKTRKESVYNGLINLNAKNDDIILIHDSARPLVDDETITANIRECQKYGAVVTAIPAIDTIVYGENNIIKAMPDRDNIFVEQTPQTFKYEIILKAHKQKLDNIEVTDDCKLVHHMGIKIHFVPGSRRNFKITYQEDLDILKAFLLVKK